jgi:P-type E1-E2 ATPase
VEIEFSIDEVEVGDIVVVKPGEKMPVDGEVVEGTTLVDESMLTGESMPVEKAIGHKIIEATIEKVTDFKQIMAYGVMKAPALVVDEKVKVMGRVPSPAEIIKYL